MIGGIHDFKNLIKVKIACKKKKGEVQNGYQCGK